jgi:hypothetical protein
MSDRVYTAEEVTALIERASELQAQTGSTGAPRGGLTLTELEGVAAEAGLDAALLGRAAQELNDPSRTLFASSTGASTTHIHVERWVPRADAAEA